MSIQRSLLALSLVSITLVGCGGSGGTNGSCDDGCESPPANVCDGDRLYTFLPIGECADGTCIYPPTITDCPAGCEDAACVEVVDLCEGVSCDAPPASVCEGDTAVQYPNDGTCNPDTGACEYTARETDCADRDLVCVDGACEPIDPCEGVVCDAPPEDTCLNPGTVQTWGEAGTCETNGTCSYSPTTINCGDTGQICSDGACVDEPPCFGDDCDVLPAPFCDGSVSVRQINGRCDEEADACVTDEERTDCALTGKICDDGLCVSDVACRGVTCNDPPDDRCEGSRLVRFVDDGVCIAGEGVCEYAREVIACSDMGMTCQDGACVDSTCLGVICAAPPDDACDGDTLRTYADRGVCEGGDCNYVPTEIDCTATGQRCDRGACVDPLPCEGVTCDETPEPYCVDDVLRVPFGGGVCEDGLCRYGESVVNCGADGRTCRDGGCRDACFEVTCEEPPAGACDEDTAIGFEPVGICRPDTGECEYTTVTTNCLSRGEVCIDGECVVDPCSEEVTCDEPPAGTCEDSVAVIPFGAGICTRGACAYAERRRDCTLDDLTCIDGDCRDACYGVACDEPPVDWCDGDTRVFYPDGGTCNPETGGCRYRATSENCASDGNICLEGECVPDPCETGELTCDELPEPTCEGDVEVVPFGDGLCERGACSFAERRTDCTVDGLECIDGGCRDACYEVACDEPPAPSCEGELLITWADEGTCDPEDGSCAYRQTTRNCDADGLLCIDGACVGDPCDDLTCDEPPEPTCEGDLLVEGFGEGTCARGECTYSTIRRDCTADGLTCVDGGCRDACYGVTCDAPPAPTCEGETLTTWSESGVCLAAADGECLYTASTTNCSDTGQLCVDGACVDDPCDTITCDEPAPATCEGDVLSEEFGVGTCERGECSYATRVRDCSVDGLECIDGDCRDACYGVTCDEPPAPACEGDVIIAYEETGTCNPSDGECSYRVATTNCAITDQLCIDGACVDDPCDTITCDEPPEAFCDGNTEVEPIGIGLCDRGECSYAERRLDCDAIDETCIDGACRDACYLVACDTPPATVCEGDTSLGYADAGSCNPATGTCTYEPIAQNCAATDQICLDGACVDDPCDELVCDTPPDQYCEGDTEVVPFGIGECTEGACSYAERRTLCDAIDQSCIDDACRDACYEVACDAPPADSCVDDTAIQYAADSGSCLLPDAECYYEPTITNCALDGRVCFDGACVADPCGDGACEELPPPTCEGTVAVVPLPGGICTLPDGDCLFEFARTDCDEFGLLCRAGACVDACEGVTCDEPPAPTCEGDNVATYGVPGTCDPILGSCGYTVAFTDCTATGQICDAGACVADPCFDVDCATPPDPTCDGVELVTYSGAGVCDPGTAECVHTESRVNCEDVGSVACLDGACVDSCDLVTCDTPPDPVCSDDLVLTFTAPGECTAETGCEYPFETTDCIALGQICEDGACVEPDACFGVACDRPPLPTCVGNSLQTSAEPGTCSEGVCTYETTLTDCGASDAFCVAGACVDEDPCEGLVCDAPPESFCIVGDLVSYAFSGTCDLSGCIYTEATTPCPDGQLCVDDACVDPCADVTCDTAPDPICLGARTVGVPSSDGTCELGACDYPVASEIDCEALGQFCDEGACVDTDPCTGVVCDAPPAPSCAGDAIQTFGVGTCTFGTCEYEVSLTDCTETGELCVDASCVANPCAGVDCDLADTRDCEDDFTARVYTYSGECIDDGVCESSVTRTDCADLVSFGFCDSGFCLSGEACPFDCTADVNFCDENEAVSQTGGRCVAGDCAYDESRTDCEADGGYCSDGACLSGDPCDDVVCDAPPGALCSGRLSISFALPGTCEDGFCTYAETVVDCEATGQWCLDGACVDTDPCEGVVCDTPPASVCTGDILFEYPADGVCIDGACTYIGLPTDCEGLGGFCLDGECSFDACEGVVCDSPPPATCLDAVTVEFAISEEGTCTDGECSYELATDDCGATGDVCIDGGCESPLTLLTAQDIVITEFVTGEDGWFEIHNTTDAEIDVSGLAITATAADETVGFLSIEEPLTIAAGGTALIASSAAIGIVGPDVVYPELIPFQIDIGDRVDVLAGPDNVIDSITTTVDWPATPTTSAQRDPASFDRASTLADWCAGTAEFFPERFGTPGGDNFACAP